MTLTLIHAPRARSSGFIWLLEELGVPYDIKVVSIRRGDGSGASDPANPHPHGKVPVIIHDGVTVHEQTAICLYLTDAFPAAGLGPVVGDAKRGAYVSWLAYYSGVMEPAFVSKFMKYDVPRGTAGWVPLDEAMAYVNQTLENGDYILGDTFSSVDILLSGAFKLFWDSPIMLRTDLLAAYVKRCTERPALARAAAKDNG